MLVARVVQSLFLGQSHRLCPAGGSGAASPRMRPFRALLARLAGRAKAIVATQKAL
jgi:hypothetical protein